MATRIAKKVNQWYLKYAEREMLIDEDEQGLYCDVPSETTEGTFHRVHVDETTVVPVATHCTCKAHEHKGDCKHCEIVNRFYARLYKSNLEKFVAKFEQETEEVETAQEALVVERQKVYDKDLCCLIYADNREIVDKAAHEAAIKAQMATWTEDLSTKGNLYSNRGYQLMRAG